MAAEGAARASRGDDERALRLVSWIARHTGAILLVALAVAALSALSLLRLRLDVDLLSMLPQGRPRFEDYQRYVARFGARDIAVAVVRAPDSATAMRFAAAFEDALAHRPEVADVRSRVDLATFAAALRAGALPRLLPLDAYPEVARRLTPEGIDEAVRNMRRILATPGSVGSAAYLAGDPLGLGALLGQSLARERPDQALKPGSEYVLSRDGKRLLMLIRPAEPGFDLDAASRLSAALHAAETHAHEASGIGDEVQVGYTGAFAYALEDATLLRTDILVYSLLALVGVLAVFLAGYRSLEILPIATFQILLGTLLTFALGLLVRGQLNAISLAFAVIFYGLGIDATIHFYTRFLEEWGGAGAIERPLARTVAGLFPAMVVAATTSAVAFVVIAFSDFAGVAQLGSLTALGMLLNIPATFLVLPAQILWAQRRGRLLRAGRPLPRTERLAAVADRALRHRVLATGAIAALLLLACLPATAARLDTNLFDLRPARSRAAAVQAELEGEFGLADPPGVVMIEAPEADDEELDEAALETAERVTAVLRSYERDGVVEMVLSPSPLLPSLATQKERLRAWAALPRARAADLLAERLARAGFKVDRFAGALAALRDVPAPVDPTLHPLPGLELLVERQLRRDRGGLALLVLFRPRDVDALATVAERLRAEVGAPGVRVAVTGRPLMERELAATMRDEMVWFLVAVALGNALLIWLRVKSVAVTLGILAVPGAVILLLAALLGASGREIDAVNLIVFPLTIGLGVDNCVYLAERCRELGEVHEAVASTGRALAITTGTTAVGFGVLALSRYPALAGLGWLAAASILLCFAATLVVIPLVLPRRWIRSGPEGTRGA